MSINPPLISVAIPYYNDSAFLKESIDSVLNQTYSNLEIILINHVSTDGSREIARSYKDIRIKHIDMLENTGAGGGTLLKAFCDNAKGEYIKLFCADDIMLPNCIEKLVNYLLYHPDIDFVFSDMVYIDNNKKRISLASEARDRFSFDLNIYTVLDNYIRGYSSLPHPTVMLKSSIIKPEDFEVTYIMRYDTFLYTQLLLRNHKAFCLKDALVLYRVHPGQLAYSLDWERAAKRGFYESFIYYPLFFKIKDIDLVKYLCRDIYFIDKLKDVELIPFIIAYFFFISKFIDQKIVGYIKLQQLLNNSTLYNKIRRIFGFSVKHFRMIYSRLDKELDYPINSDSVDNFLYKNYELDFTELVKLFIIQLKSLFNHNKIKKRIRKLFNFPRIFTKSSCNLKLFEIIYIIIYKVYFKIKGFFK